MHVLWQTRLFIGALHGVMHVPGTTLTRLAECITKGLDCHRSGSRVGCQAHALVTSMSSPHLVLLLSLQGHDHGGRAQKQPYVEHQIQDSAQPRFSRHPIRKH